MEHKKVKQKNNANIQIEIGLTPSTRLVRPSVFVFHNSQGLVNWIIKLSRALKEKKKSKMPKIRISGFFFCIVK